MQITKDNFAIYALDYLEGGMSAPQQALFESYLEQSSEAAEQIALFEGSLPILSPEAVSYPDTSSLLRSVETPLWRRVVRYGTGAVAASLLLGIFAWATRHLTPRSAEVAQQTQSTSIQESEPLTTPAMAMEAEPTATLAEVLPAAVVEPSPKAQVFQRRAIRSKGTTSTRSASAPILVAHVAPQTLAEPTPQLQSTPAEEVVAEPVASLPVSENQPLTQPEIVSTAAAESAFATEQGGDLMAQLDLILQSESTPAPETSLASVSTQEYLAEEFASGSATRERNNSAVLSTLKSMLPVKRYESSTSSGVEIASILRIGTHTASNKERSTTTSRAQ